MKSHISNNLVEEEDWTLIEEEDWRVILIKSTKCIFFLIIIIFSGSYSSVIIRDILIFLIHECVVISRTSGSNEFPV